MRDGLRILVVGGDPGLAEKVRQCVAQSQPPASVQWLRNAALALARVGGGDIDAVVVDPASTRPGGDDLGDLPERRASAMRKRPARAPQSARRAKPRSSGCWARRAAWAPPLSP